MARWARLAVAALVAGVTLLSGPSGWADETEPEVVETSVPADDTATGSADPGGLAVTDAPLPVEPVAEADAQPEDAAPADDELQSIVQPLDWMMEDSLGAPLPRGMTVELNLTLYSPGWPAEAILQVSVPAPSTIVAVFVRKEAVACVPSVMPGTVECPINVNADLTPLVFEVGTPADTPIGSEVPMTATIVPTVADPDISNNTFVHEFEVIGTVDLAYQLTPSDQTLVVGHTLDMVFTVTNQGPDTATGALGWVWTSTYPELRLVAVGSPEANIEARESDGAPGFAIAWQIGHLGPGESRSLAFTVEAFQVPEEGQSLVFGSAHVFIQRNRAASDEQSELLRVVRPQAPVPPSTTSTSSAPSTTTPTPTPTSPTTTTPPKAKGPTLAATGQAVGGLAIYGGISVLVGAAFLLSARRRKA